MSQQYECVIVGGGISGLSAALQLKDKGITNVVILEAADRIGGRIQSSEMKSVIDAKFEKKHGWAGTECNIGAQWVFKEQRQLFAMLKRFNLETFEQDVDGKSVMQHGENMGKYTGTIPPLPYTVLVDMQMAIWKTNKWANGINLEEPWRSKNAEKYDSMNVLDYLKEKLWTKGATHLYYQFCHTVFCCEPQHINFLFFLYYIHAAGGIDHLINNKNGAQDSLVKGNLYSLVTAIVNELGQDMIKTNSAVTKIDYSNGKDQITITTASGEVYHSKRVILAISPKISATIEYNPPMPADRVELCKRQSTGNLIKCIVSFKTKWWKKNNLAGFALAADNETSPVECCFDGTYQNSIVGFLLADRAKKFGALSIEDRKEAILRQYSKFFETDYETVKEECLDYIEKIWNSEAYFEPNTFIKYGKALREPIGQIYFAGTETATNWTGFVNGAIQSGQRAANEIYLTTLY
jgi:monoamine oxidase